ncbi:hypothetical protein FHR99_002723 [Litorivivens lipolytica]|uniref:Uncharacterized protein n=1 Tax=Litorivivens lipolytica TaxID=1524264 RepID=A0A7W4W7Q5_9GAMM|nr:hypothetical protein [Litorivivens lipolytica]MBB3048449.1 hypothetical protein [Litorivivens lipolytica]
MSWIDDSCRTFEEVFALRENLYRDYQAFESVFSEQKLLDKQLMALCKQRCAQLHRSAHRVASLSNEQIEALPQWYNRAEFTSLEKAALQLTECFCLDPHSISDAMAAAVVDEIGDEGLVALLEYLALCDGFTRFRVMLQVEEAA